MFSALHRPAHPGFVSLAVIGLLTSCTAAPSAVSAPVPAASASAIATAAPGAWSYAGATGPEAWGTLSPDYAACSDGSAQSPIDIAAPAAADLPNIVYSYSEGEAGLIDNGHSVEAEPMTPGGNSIELEGLRYLLTQLHFHAPSEHQISGQSYPLEVHFVHQSEDGQLAVIGVFVKQGAENAAWKPFTDQISAATDNPEANVVSLDWSSLLPATQTAIRYEGSLTTPGCTEGVAWNVVRQPLSMSAEQIAAFTSEYSGNKRPVQPLDGRTVQIDSTPAQ